MPDINIDVSYPEHRKTKRTVGLLGRGSDVLPIRLWLYCGRQHSDDGKLIGYSAQEIESVCDWWGEKGKMVEAFLAVGWLEEFEWGFQVHDWLEHQGHLKSYRERAKAASKARWSKLPDPTRNATSIPPSNAHAPPSNAPNRIAECSSVSSPNGVSKGGAPPPVEFPSSFPPDEKAAVQWARVGSARATDDQIVKFWNDAATRGGTEIGGQVIRSWVSYCNSRAMADENRAGEKAFKNGATNGHAKPMTTYDLNSRKTNLDEMMADLKNRFASEVAGGQMKWADPEKRKAYFKFKGERDELTKKLAGQ